MRLKTVRRILFLPFIVLTFLAYLLPVPSNAASVTDTITLQVGYFGGPYYEKTTYNWKQLDDNFGGALDSHQVAYSYNSGSRTAIDSARGFYLSDLLEYAGIDIGSISSLSFYTKDQEVGAFATFPKSSLLDSARYYFPNISMNADKQLVPLNGGDLTDGAVRVDTMLALEDSWEWDAVDSNFTNLSPASRFRLVFGQTGPTEVRTSQSAKYVHTIYVTFAGAPVMSTDQDNLSMKVGSDYQVKVKLGTADPVLDKNLGGSIKWSSSDTSVVTVDDSGNLTAVSNGSAVITAATGKTSMSVKVSVGDGVGTGNGLGSGTGTGSGNGSGPGNGDSGGQTVGITGKAGTNSPAAGTEPKSSNLTTAAPSPSAKPATEASPSPDISGTNAYVLSGSLMSQAEYAAWAKSILEQSEQGGGSPGAGTKMSADSTQLILKQQDKPLVTLIVTLSTCFILFLGAMCCVIKFKHQLKR